MSDFLTRVVLHAGRGLGVVRPRPVARFEEPAPAGTVAEPHTIEAPADERTWHERRAEHERPQSPRGEQTPPVPPAESVSPPPADHHGAPARPVGPHPTVQWPEPVAPPPPSPTQAGVVSHDRTPEGRAGVQSSPSSTTANRPPAVESRVVERRVEITRVQEVAVDSRRSVPQAAARREEPHAGIVPAPARRAPGKVRPAHAVAAIETRREPTQAAPEASADRTVTVEVTIGRVDVRAVMPTRSQPREQKARTPELSLEEYLRQRGRGRA